MTIISNKTFGGMIPRIPADKLPADKAQSAINCNFAYGELRPLKAPFLITTLANAAKSIFSTDGIRFFSWPWRTKAWKGPVINDSYYRMYFTGQSGGMRVAQTTDMRINGGEPAVSYKVGVPAVAASPEYQLVDRTSLPDYPNTSFKLYSLYVLDGKRYNETEIASFNMTVPFKEFTFFVPEATRETSTDTTDPETGVVTTTTTPGVPASAVFAVRVDLKDESKGSTIFSMTTSVSSTPTRSDAVPGGVEARLLKNGTDAGYWKLELQYGVVETRVYTVTMVNQWMEESKPSPVVVVQPTYMQEVVLSFVPPSSTDYVPVNQFRLYRSVDSGGYLAVGGVQSFSGTPVTVRDSTVNITDTDATLESTTWDMPPAALRGLTLLPNGFFAGFVGDTVYFSEPYRPWAWPYSMTFPYTVVGMRAIESSLVVATNTYPYMVNGVHPSAMNQAQLMQSQGAISDHGMTVVGSVVSFISNDGLVGVKGYDVDLAAGQAFWTRELWKEIFGGYINQMELAYHDGSLVCGTPVPGQMWEIRLDSEGGGNLTMRDGTTYADALYVLPASDQLYAVRGNKLYQHNGSAANQDYDWAGKDHILPKPTLFTAGYINCVGDVRLTVYADGVVRHTQVFTGKTYFRMPTGQKALRWSIRLSGSATVKEISLAERREELARV